MRLTKTIYRNIGRLLAMAWMDELIELYRGEMRETTMYFGYKEFGDVFDTLGWNKNRRIKITIGWEEKKRDD